MSMTSGGDILEATLAGLETGLRVRHITTYALDTCEPDANVASVLSDPCLINFDCIPVRSNGAIIGYVQRAPDAHGLVSDQMKTLEESVLVSADLALTQFVPLIPAKPFRLVLDGVTIRGIVTWSDLQKLPVRLYVFSLVTHLEMLMLYLIKSRKPRGEDWLDLLPPARQSKIKKDFERLRAARLDPAMLEFTSFGDKRQIIVALLGLDDSASAEPCDIQTQLRDAVDHTASYADSPAAVQDFTRRLEGTQRWIERLTPETSVTGHEGTGQ